MDEQEYMDEIDEMGLEPHLTEESTIAIAEDFEELIFGIDGTKSFGELREMHQKLNPSKHARSPKRHLLHKRAVERRKKRKNGGKK